ncbi:E3 ubiquitin-protein ligase MARCHF7 [Musca domestica]|nr:E3 ubiquitin-protein ligase MARCHF7 [Musca domestica]
MTDNQPAPSGLSVTSAIRLYNSVAVNDENMVMRPIITARREDEDTMSLQKSIETLMSLDENGNSCRICRWNRSDLDIMESPCLCRGTVGHIHLQCLKRWIMHRRNIHCEICNASFIIPVEKLSWQQKLANFCKQCAIPIVRNLLFSFSLLPLGHVVLQQVLFCMETINQSPNERLTFAEIMVASCTLMTSSALFFHFFEFTTTRLFLIRNILRQWWNFGNITDFPPVEIDSGLFDFL